MKNILVVVDMQNDFITGSLGSSAAEAIVPEVVNEINKAIENGDYIFLTRDTHGKDYMQSMEGRKLPVKHCINGTQGWEINSEIMNAVNKASVGNVQIINKPTFGSYFLATSIKNITQTEEINEVRICGLCTDICVVSNALLLKANLKDTEIVVNSKACAGTSEDNHNAALTVMKCCQCNIQ